jgi:hypothetical protein
MKCRSRFYCNVSKWNFLKYDLRIRNECMIWNESCEQYDLLAKYEKQFLSRTSEYKFDYWDEMYDKWHVNREYEWFESISLRCHQFDNAFSTFDIFH